jgi:hypothetical protein
MAPKGTPAAVVAKLNAEIGRIVSRQDVRDDWAKQGRGADVTMTPRRVHALPSRTSSSGSAS